MGHHAFYHTDHFSEHLSASVIIAYSAIKTASFLDSNPNVFSRSAKVLKRQKLSSCFHHYYIFILSPFFSIFVFSIFPNAPPQYRATYAVFEGIAMPRGGKRQVWMQAGQKRRRRREHMWCSTHTIFFKKKRKKVLLYLAGGRGKAAAKRGKREKGLKEEEEAEQNFYATYTHTSPHHLPSLSSSSCLFFLSLSLLAFACHISFPPFVLL